MERVIGDDDLLEEILLRLPAEIVHACKPVSKRWRNLISSLPFCRRHATFLRHHPSINNGKLFLFDQEEKSAMTLLDIGNGVIKISNIESAKLFSSIQPYYETLRQKISESKEIEFRICDSYNGLFLFTLIAKRKRSDTFDFNQREHYYCLVCNPLTKDYQKLKLLKWSPYTQLAFAPSKDSSYYKVVVAYFNEDTEFIVRVYSSETRTWEDLGCLGCRGLYHFKYVVWDNCLLVVPRGNWSESVLVRVRVLDLDKLCVSSSSSLLPDSIEKNKKCMIYYFGESGGFLYVIAKVSKRGWGRVRSKYMLWELKGIDGSWNEKFQFNIEKGFIILHVHRDDEHVWLLIWDISAGIKVYYCFNGDTQCLQEAGDVPTRSLQWNILYHTPTLFPLQR